MDLKRITLLCSIFIAINAFVNGEKQNLQQLIRQRRETTKAPLIMTTLLPTRNVIQRTQPFNKNLDLKVYKISSDQAKSNNIGQVIKQISTTGSTPVLILCTTRKPMTTKPMVPIVNNIVNPKASKTGTAVIEHYDANSSHESSEIDHDITNTTVQPNLCAKETLQAISAEEHIRNQVNDVHEDHLDRVSKAKKDNRKQTETEYHVRDENGKKITEITTTKIIEENLHNDAGKRHSNDKCDVLDLSDEDYLIRHLNEENEKDKSMVELHKLSQETAGALTSDNFHSVTAHNIDDHYHEISTDLKDPIVHFLDESSHDIKHENNHHEIDCDIKNKTVHVVEENPECSNDKKAMSIVKQCNTTQQLMEKGKQSHLQGLSVDVKNDHTNTTIKVKVETPKIDVIKPINVSPNIVKPSVKATTKPIILDLNKNEIKEVAKIPISQLIDTIISDKHNQHVALAKIEGLKPFFEIVNMTKCNITKGSNHTTSKGLDMERIKFTTKTAPVDCKKPISESVVQNESVQNGNSTNFVIDLDGERNDTNETITIHRHNVEEYVYRSKVPYVNNIYGNSFTNINDDYVANSDYLPNYENAETLSTTSAANNVLTDCNYNVVNTNYIPNNIAKYYNYYAKNRLNNNYDNYHQAYNANDNTQSSLNQEQKPNNYFLNYMNSEYYPSYQNVIPSYKQNYQNNLETDNTYLNTNTNYLQNYKPNTNKVENCNTYIPWKYDNVKTLPYNTNIPTTYSNYKENYIPGKYHDRIWRTWNNMDIVINNKGVPLKIEFGKDDKNTIHLHNLNKCNTNLNNGNRKNGRGK